MTKTKAKVDYNLENVGVSNQQFSEQVEFLWELLKERDSSVNISHKEMPAYEKHVEFISSNPYEEMYIITNSVGDYIGDLYLSKQNEIGIFIAKAYHRQGYASTVLKDYIEEFFESFPTQVLYANINPGNHKSKLLFESLGFELLERDKTQDVYVLSR